MIRVVLDTNVFISGTFWSGDSSKIIGLIEKGIVTLIASTEILAEYKEILYSEEIKTKVDNHHEKSQAIHKVTQLANFVQPVEKISLVKDDPDDNKFIEAAIAGNA